MRAEKKSLDRADVNALPLLRDQKDISEDEVLQDFQAFFDGQWLNLIGMTATQTTVEHEAGASRAIDGNPSTDWTHHSCTHTKYEFKPWWEVELQTAYHISAVKVTNRDQCCGEQCDICNAMDVMVDETICKSQVGFRKGQTKEIGCPFVGTVVRVSLIVEDYLMLCEVKVKGTPQSLLQMGVSQCERHSYLAQPIMTRNATHGRCVAGSPAFDNSDFAAGFHEELVGRALMPTSELRATSEECQEHLLNSNELVEGAVWQEPPAPLKAKGEVMGSCRLLMGRRVVGADHALGASCFRKLRCPHDMAPWRKKAGFGLAGGMRWG